MYVASSCQIHQLMKTNFILSVDKNVYKDEHYSEAVPFFDCMVQVHTVKTETTFKSNATVVLPIRLVLPIVLKPFERYLL